MSANETLLIVVATEAERPDLDLGEDVQVLVCGVGKIGAALGVADRLARGGVTDVVSFGVAGAYPSLGLAVGDVVVATAVAALDEGRQDPEGFTPFDQMPVPGAEWRATDETLRGLIRSSRDGEFAIVHGRVATVSVCAGTDGLAAERLRSAAIAEGMEGAAVAEAAARGGVAFAEVRGVSNMCGPREGRPFDLTGAVASASLVLRTLVDEWRAADQESA